MGRLVVVLDPDVKVSPAQLAAAWDGDAEARAAGSATTETAPPGDFFGVLELVVIPLLVNLASSAVTGMVSRLVAKVRPARLGLPDLEITEVTSAGGDRVVVVRLRGNRP